MKPPPNYEFMWREWRDLVHEQAKRKKHSRTPAAIEKETRIYKELIGVSMSERQSLIDRAKQGDFIALGVIKYRWKVTRWVHQGKLIVGRR